MGFAPGDDSRVALCKYFTAAEGAVDPSLWTLPCSLPYQLPDPSLGSGMWLSHLPDCPGAPGQGHSVKRATQCNEFWDSMKLPVQWILGVREASCPVQWILGFCEVTSAMDSGSP